VGASSPVNIIGPCNMPRDKEHAKHKLMDLLRALVNGTGMIS
jgi:hypothetical protein